MFHIVLLSFMCVSVEAFSVSSSASFGKINQRTNRIPHLQVVQSNADILKEAEKDRELLQRAALSRDVDVEEVLDAIKRLEKSRKATSDANEILSNIKGDWRLIFTTGERKLKIKSGK